MPQQPPDSLRAWMDHYLSMAVQGVRSETVHRKIRLHLNRFHIFFANRYGQEKLSAWVKRDVEVWRNHLADEELVPSTINNHVASLSGFATWVAAQDPALFSMGDPTKGVGELPLPPLEPRALNDHQVQSLKNLCDRLLPYYRSTSRRWQGRETEAPLRAKARPWRDRAIVFVLLSTGLRREELVNLNLAQVEPHHADELRQGRRARIHGVVGKGKTQRDVFLSRDARHALADYLEREHPDDRTTDSADETPLFLTAVEIASRRADGRLSPRSVNNILIQIGRWHDADIDDGKRHISPLRLYLRILLWCI